MKKMACFYALFSLVFISTPLVAQVQRTYGNDTLVDKSVDANDLFRYLKGSWQTKGSWQILEGEGKIKYSTRATFSGTETYSPVLNGHFMERSLNARVSYYSRDFGKKITNNFNALTFYTYNQNIDSFFFWYYDSTGSFLDAKGTFSHSANEYTFETQGIDERGNPVSQRHVIKVIDPNQYQWEVLQKTVTDYEWSTAASGVSNRSGKKN